MPKAVISERSEILACGLEATLGKAGCEVVGCTTREDELSSLVGSSHPDLTIFGRNLPSSHAVLDKVMGAAPGAVGIALRDVVESADVLTLAAQGVIGILHTEAGLPHYRACIGSILEKCSWIDPEFLPDLLMQRQKKATDLTFRESQIMELVQRGGRNKQIARTLGITEGTVKMHLHHIFTKLKLATRTELALAASRDPPGSTRPQRLLIEFLEPPLHENATHAEGDRNRETLASLLPPTSRPIRFGTS